MSLSVRCRNAFGLNDHDTDSRESSSLSSFVFDLRKSSPSSSSSPFPAASLPRWTRPRAPSGSPPARDFREKDFRALRRSRCLPCGSARVCAPPSTSSPPPPEAAPSPGGPPRGSRADSRGARTRRRPRRTRRRDPPGFGCRSGTCARVERRRTTRASGAELELRERSFGARVLVGSCGAPRLGNDERKRPREGAVERFDSRTRGWGVCGSRNRKRAFDRQQAPTVRFRRYLTAYRFQNDDENCVQL